MEVVIQLLINSILAASLYALVGASFLLIYRTCHFFDISHAMVFTAGAYFGYLFSIWLGIPLPVAGVLSVLSCALLGSALRYGLYLRLRGHGASPLVLLLTSLGTYVVLQNAVSIIFGDDNKALPRESIMPGLAVGGAHITSVQIVIATTATVTLGFAWLVLKKTRMGKSMRAVADDAALADVCGISSERVILLSAVAASFLAGGAGFLSALDVDMFPTMGMRALLMGIVAAIVGGERSIAGVALGALVLGLTQQFGAWQMGSQWQDFTAFAVLFVFLLLRPQGFLGREMKTATV
jgi:branched-subunit amino acid ABC-type transport system permease component